MLAAVLALPTVLVHSTLTARANKTRMTPSLPDFAELKIMTFSSSRTPLLSKLAGIVARG